MPDAVFCPGGRAAVEFHLDLDAGAAHDGEGVLHERLEVEVQRDLVGVVRGRDRLDALHREYARFFPLVAVADQVQAARGIPESVGVHFAAGDFAARDGIVAHLDAGFLGNGVGDPLHDLAVVFVAFVRAEADGKGVFELVHEREPVGGQRGGGLAQRGLERGMQRGAFQRRNQPPAERERHQLGGGEPEGRGVARAVEHFPTGVSVDSFGEQGKAGGFDGFEIAPQGAGVGGGAGFQRGRQLVEREAVACPLQLLEKDQLADRLVVARHGALALFGSASGRARYPKFRREGNGGGPLRRLVREEKSRSLGAARECGRPLGPNGRSGLCRSRSGARLARTW